MTLLTYETLITCSPLFQIDILAGWMGRKNKCGQVYLNKRPNEENSIIIINYCNDAKPLLEELLKDNNCSGTIILSDQPCDLPSTIIDLANQIKKPVLSLKNYNGEALCERINELLHLHENKLLTLMKNDLTTYWFELLNEYGMEHVIERFIMFLGQEVFLFTNKKKYVPLLSSKFTARDFKKLETLHSNVRQEGLQFSIVQNERAEFYFFEISNRDGQSGGYLSIEKNCSPEELPFHLLKTILPMLNSWLKQKEETRNVHLLYKDQFLFDILHNNIDTESELIELGQLKDMEFTANAFVLSMNLYSHHTITKEVVMNIQQLLVENSIEEANIFTTYLNHRIVGIVCPTIGCAEITKNELDHWIGKVLNLIHKIYPALQAKVGVGRKYYSNLDIYKSFQESKIALQMEIHGPGTDGIIHYEDLGFVRLLSYIHNDLLKDFSDQYLGKLENYDKENETELVYTLTVYCAQNGDIARTADGLFIHQNTLRQRLKKIESILNMELNNYNNLVNLILSLQISQDLNMN